MRHVWARLLKAAITNSRRGRARVRGINSQTHSQLMLLLLSFLLFYCGIKNPMKNDLRRSRHAEVHFDKRDPRRVTCKEIRWTRSESDCTPEGQMRIVAAKRV